MPQEPKDDLRPRRGDIVEVSYLGGTPARCKVVDETVIPPDQLERAQKYHPHLKTGDKYYIVEHPDGETRSFYAHDIKILSALGREQEQREFEQAKKETWKDIEKDLREGLPKPIKPPKPIRLD